VADNGSEVALQLECQGALLVGLNVLAQKQASPPVWEILRNTAKVAANSSSGVCKHCADALDSAFPLRLFLCPPGLVYGKFAQLPLLGPSDMFICTGNICTYETIHGCRKTTVCSTDFPTAAASLVCPQGNRAADRQTQSRGCGGIARPAVGERQRLLWPILVDGSKCSLHFAFPWLCGVVCADARAAGRLFSAYDGSVGQPISTQLPEFWSTHRWKALDLASFLVGF
jgi:hypothetical protein